MYKCILNLFIFIPESIVCFFHSYESFQMKPFSLFKSAIVLFVRFLIIGFSFFLCCGSIYLSNVFLILPVRDSCVYALWFVCFVILELPLWKTRSVLKLHFFIIFCMSWFLFDIFVGVCRFLLSKATDANSVSSWFGSVFYALGICIFSTYGNFRGSLCGVHL